MPVSLTEYQNFLDRLKVQGIDCSYMQLDSIGNAEATRKNYSFMVLDGFKSIPIFTRGAPMEDFEYFTHHLPERIAVGGISIKAGNSPGYVKWFMEHPLRDKNIPLHWLGFAERDFILTYRPFSVDSSEWVAPSRFKRILLFVRGRLIVVTKDNWRNHWAEIEALGFEPGYLKSEEAWYGSGESYVQYVSTVSYLKYIEQIYKRAGTLMYMVVVKSQNLRCLKNILEKTVPDGKDKIP